MHVNEYTGVCKQTSAHVIALVCMSALLYLNSLMYVYVWTGVCVMVNLTPSPEEEEEEETIGC